MRIHVDLSINIVRKLDLSDEERELRRQRAKDRFSK